MRRNAPATLLFSALLPLASFAHPWAAPALAQAPAQPPQISEVDFAGVMAGERASLVLVKDFIRLENTGPLLGEIQFDRYSPVIDPEQIVLGRWLTARTTGGTQIPADLASVAPDPANNLILTIRLRPLPPRQVVTVTITSLVARRETPPPSAPFAIPAPEEYPPEVRAYLAGTAMVVTNHPEIRKAAEELRAACNGDALKLAAEIARRAKDRPYLPEPGADMTLPTSVLVLRHGGSCCASAVSAAALLRACGIPAHITYCPAGYIHGITRFYLHGQGGGWFRMDATSGTGNYPLMKEAADLGLVRIYDTPIQMEKIHYAYAWPFQHNDVTGEYRFRSDGKPCPQVRMFAGDPSSLPWVMEPFPHLEPGSFNAVLGTEKLPGPWLQWPDLVAASRAGAQRTTLGPFPVADRLPEVKPYLNAASTWAMP